MSTKIWRNLLGLAPDIAVVIASGSVSLLNNGREHDRRE
jgi:hypothetical protein